MGSGMEIKSAMREAGEWLVSYGGSKIKEKVRDKILEELGLKSAYAIFTGDFPAAKLASFTVSVMKIGYFYGFYELYHSRRWNPYNPKVDDQVGPYSEYLLYSTRKGSAGYVYQFAGGASL